MQEILLDIVPFTQAQDCLTYMIGNFQPDRGQETNRCDLTSEAHTPLELVHVGAHDWARLSRYSYGREGTCELGLLITRGSLPATGQTIKASSVKRRLDCLVVSR